MNRYTWNGINTGTLPTHCERIAKYWATLVCFYEFASGKARGQRYKAARAFQNGLRFRGLPEDQINQAYADTVAMARLIQNAK